MLHSRVFTPAFRFYATVAVAALVGAFISAVGSSDQGLVDSILGPVTLGWKGGVGDHLAYMTLVSLAVVSGALAGIHIAFRDADPESEAEIAGVESAPLTRAPSGTNFLPIVGVFALGAIIIGQVTDRLYTLAGIGLLLVVALMWMLRAWAERATGDVEVNRQLYQRFIEPFRIPVLALLAVAVVIIGFSRVLLALSHTGAVAVFGVVATVLLLVVGFIAARPSITKNSLTILLFLGAVAMIVAGIVAAVVAEEDVDHDQIEQAINVEQRDGRV